MLNYYYQAYNKELLEYFRAEHLNRYCLSGGLTYHMSDSMVKGELFNGILGPMEWNDGSDFKNFVFFENGQIHNFLGPAIYNFDTLRQLISVSWVFKGKEVNSIRFPHSAKEYFKWAKESGIDLYNVTSEDEQLIKMKWL